MQAVDELNHSFFLSSQDDPKLRNEEIEVFCYNGQPYTGKVFAKHSNGKIGLVGEFSKGIKNGTWTYWYSTGEKKRESSYVEGKKEGTTYYWHQNGQMHKHRRTNPYFS